LHLSSLESLFCVSVVVFNLVHSQQQQQQQPFDEEQASLLSLRLLFMAQFCLLLLSLVLAEAQSSSA